MPSTDAQRKVCDRVGSAFDPVHLSDKVGIALDSLHMRPLNALRHPPEAGTTGWFIWGGDFPSTAADFFQPLHVYHLSEYVPQLKDYLALTPGWRVLLASGVEDVWFDAGLLNLGRDRA